MTIFWTRPFADTNINLANMMISVFDRVENIVGKGDNASLSAFSPFPTMFLKGFFCTVVKTKPC